MDEVRRALSAVGRALDGRGALTSYRAGVLQQAAAPDRASSYKCAHPEVAGMGWRHPWPDQPMEPHACCGVREHCPSRWLRQEPG
ncbi:MAG: hypothetical protein CMH83_04845 [Nocardioides sp.]|nr:hypothetical protein [Nocardioides sp.]